MRPIHTANAITALSIAVLGRSVRRRLDSRERNDSVALESAKAVQRLPNICCAVDIGFSIAHNLNDDRREAKNRCLVNWGSVHEFEAPINALTYFQVLASVQQTASHSVLPTASRYKVHPSCYKCALMSWKFRWLRHHNLEAQAQRETLTESH